LVSGEFPVSVAVIGYFCALTIAASPLFFPCGADPFSLLSYFPELSGLSRHQSFGPYLPVPDSE